MFVIIALSLLQIGRGTLNFTPSQIMESLFGTGDNSTADRVIWRICLPRLVTALFVGASLGMAGSVFSRYQVMRLALWILLASQPVQRQGQLFRLLFNAGPLETSLAAVISGICAAILVFVLSLKGVYGWIQAYPDRYRCWCYSFRY